MPELPEVETVRRGLMDTIVGRRIESADVSGLRTVRRTSPEAVADGLTGATITGFGRRGKYLLGQLDSGLRLMIHLRMSGQVLVAAPGATPPPHAHVRIRFSPATAAATGTLDAPAELWFVDPRTFGEVVVYEPSQEPSLLPELARLGVDPVADPFDRLLLAGLLRSRSRQLKALLVDQHVIAGIGNIYADEILHRARVHPDRISSSLSSGAITRLHVAIGAVLGAAIEARGSTLADAQYVDLMGAPGNYQHDHAVYGRAGKRCRTCGRGIIRRTVRGRSAHFCPVCQRAPQPIV